MSKNEFYLVVFFGKQIPRQSDIGDPRIRGYIDDIVKHFNTGVDFLRDNETFPNTEINELMSLFWRLVGNEITPTRLDIHARFLYFLPEAIGWIPDPSIRVPPNFSQLCLEDPTAMMGAQVFAASKARDYWNHRLYPIEDSDSRAYAYETEALLTLINLGNPFTPTVYQDTLMGLYPEGLKTLAPSLQYVSRPITDADIQQYHLERIFSI